MKHATSRLLFAYWDGLRGERPPPERAQIEPGQIRPRLGDTFILALESGSDPSFRLAGTRVCALFGRDLKGVSLAQLWPGDRRAELDQLIDLVANDTAGIVAGFVGSSQLGSPIALELILLPLKHRGATDRRAIGALSPSSVPSWLGLAPLDSLEMRSLRVINGSGQSADSPELMAIGATRPSRRYPFVVLQGGRDGGPTGRL